MFEPPVDRICRPIRCAGSIEECEDVGGAWPAFPDTNFEAMIVSEGVREKGNPVGQTARDLGISEFCLRNWMNRDAVDSGRKPGLTTDEHKELVEVRRRLRVLEMENETLRSSPG